MWFSVKPRIQIAIFSKLNACNFLNTENYLNIQTPFTVNKPTYNETTVN